MPDIIANLFTIDVLIALLLGVFVGMIIGILPGLGATMAIALMIPMTYGWDPTASLVLLCSIYTTATFGGSMSAILLCTPGTPSSAATAQDGYELTKQGRGLEAMGISTVSSVFGGVVGGIALLLIAPPLAQFALRFSSPEYFFIALFGLTIIGSLAGNDPLKGFLSGALGLLFCCVGMDGNTAYVRYAFGNIRLYSGIAMVPMMIGLFSVSQMMMQAERLVKKGAIEKGQVLNDDTALGTKFLPTFKEFLHLLPLMCRASILGLLIGILPGAGGDIGSWVGYNEAKRTAKDKSKFGHGALEGVCGSESANNAVCGGAYIPLLTLGIPGSGAAAVLMGGLTLHGLAPGSTLFTKNADIVYPIIIGYILANLLMAVIGVFACRKIVKVAAIPMNVITPLVLVLAVIGAYAINLSIFDVWIMLAFGLLGYIMRKADFPTAPCVLAMILGPMAEKGLHASLQMALGKNIILFFAGRPLCVVFFIATVASIVVPLAINKRKKSGSGNKTEEDGAYTVVDD